MQAAKDIYAYLEKMLADKRKTPAEDLASNILDFKIDDRDITDKEILGMYYLLFVGGLDTVASSLGYAFPISGKKSSSATKNCVTTQT